MNIPTNYRVNKSNSISNNIAFCYAVNENTGNVLNDISGNGYNCQLMNSPVWLGNGVLKFSGRQGTKEVPLPSQYGVTPSYSKLLSSATFLVILTFDEIKYCSPGLIYSRAGSQCGLGIFAGGECVTPGSNIPPSEYNLFGPAAVGYNWNDKYFAKQGPPVSASMRYMIAVTITPTLAVLYLYDYSTSQLLSVSNAVAHDTIQVTSIELMRDSSTWDMAAFTSFPDSLRYANCKLEFAVMWERGLASSELSQIAVNPSVFLGAPVTCPDLANTFTIQKG